MMIFRSAGVRWGIVIVAFVAIIGLIRFKPWERKNDETPISAAGTTNAETAKPMSGKREELSVGFLPVTCHLTCPVTDFATRTSQSNHFTSQRFQDWPTVAEAFKSGRLDATFMIAPLAMKMREQGVPCKITYLGHRDGSTVMVRKEDPAKSLMDLRGRVIAVPSFQSNQYLVLRKLMEDEKIKEGDIKFVTLPPPDMPGALATKAVDAYFVGEPHAARAELDGTGRVLYHAKDIWPKFISCVLVVSERLIKEKPAVVRDLVRGIAESGEWAEQHRLEAAKVAAPYFKQKEELLKYVLTRPPDRVSYRMLTPTMEEMQQIADVALKTGVLDRRVTASDILDLSFIPKDIKPANFEMTDAGKAPNL